MSISTNIVLLSLIVRAAARNSDFYQDFYRFPLGDKWQYLTIFGDNFPMIFDDNFKNIYH